MHEIVLVATRFLFFGGAMFCFALTFFSSVILGSRGVSESNGNNPAFSENLRRMLTVALLVEGISGVAWFLIGGTGMMNLPWILWGLLLLAMISVLSLQKLSTPGWTYLTDTLLAALGGGVLVTLAWVSQRSSSASSSLFLCTANAAHLLAGAVWPIGLIPITILLRPIAQCRENFSTETTAILRRFSQSNLFAVGILVSTGTITACLRFGSWPQLLASFNGKLFLVKVLLVAVMIGLGAVNRYCFLPGLAENPGKLKVLQQIVRTECCLGVPVLILVSLHR